MGDLISREEVCEILHKLGGCDATEEWSKGWDSAIDTAINELDKIPTAYDVDKVVANLKSHNNSQKVSTVKPFNGQHRYYRAVSVTKAIKIVKGGGVDE